ncbi:uncharacterized protein [Branchiostoma lanceolatum]|uniref:uncharacterized protein n=1 Tax=Branchiostoma lanceolatum TaxID=7740 RepID=UPI0034544949
MGLSESKRGCCGCVPAPWKRLKRNSVGVMETSEWSPRPVSPPDVFVVSPAPPRESHVTASAQASEAEAERSAQASEAEAERSAQASEAEDERSAQASEAEDDRKILSEELPEAEPVPVTPKRTQSMRLIFVQEAPPEFSIRTVGGKGAS